MPANYSPTLPQKWRLDLWCHGRGEKLTELSFLADRMRSPGQFTPPGAVVLHLLRTLLQRQQVRRRDRLPRSAGGRAEGVPIDPNRRVIRGFSMGGAACWQFAVHYPDLWAAAAPGAGFSETEEFLNFFQGETVKPPAWERTLFR